MDIVLLEFKLLQNCKQEYLPIIQNNADTGPTTLPSDGTHTRAQSSQEKNLTDIQRGFPWSARSDLQRSSSGVWSHRGGTTTPVCTWDHSNSSQIRLALRSAASNFLPKWLYRTNGSERFFHWKTEESNLLHISFHPVLSSMALWITKFGELAKEVT